MSSGFQVLALLALFALTNVALGQQPVSVLRFTNETDATIRLESVPGGDSTGFVLQLLEPRQRAEIAVAPGWLVLDVVAFKANPHRTHRVAIEILPDEGADFRFTAYRLGLYLLEDAGSLAALPVLPSVQAVPLSGKENGSVPVLQLAQACKPPLNNWDGAALWQTAEYVQYYRRTGRYLCGVDGRDVFEQGEIFAHYVCAEGWLDCLRHEAGDFRLLPHVRSSEILDAATKIARTYDPSAGFIQTRQTVMADAPAQEVNLTTFIAMGTDYENPECPTAYRLHYQGFCINIADELADDPDKEIRTLEPSR